MKARGAGPHHVEPGADDDEDAARHAPGVPARGRRPHASPTTTRSSGVIAERYLDYDVRAVAGHHVLVHAPLREGARRGARRAAGRARSRVATSGRTCACSSAAASSAAPYLPVHPRPRRARRRDAGRHVQRDRRRRLRGVATSRGARGMLDAPAPRDVLRVRPARRARRARPPTRVPLWEVERDRPYSIVVTTSSGLYAYELGDIVRFPSLEPLRIEFMGRLSGCLSVTQELTTHVEIERAVAHAVARRSPCTHARLRRRGATWASTATAKSRYVLFVEFQEGAAPADLRRLRRARSTRASATRTASTASTARATWRSCRRASCRSSAAARGAFWKRSRAATSKGSSRASSTTRRRSCFGRTRHSPP